MHKKVTSLVIAYGRADLKARVKLTGRLANIIGVSVEGADKCLRRLVGMPQLCGDLNLVEKQGDSTIFVFGPEKRPGEGLRITLGHSDTAKEKKFGKKKKKK